jgi:PAS domain S-box-containing protein
VNVFSNERILSTLRRLVTFAVIVSIVVSSLVLLGWALDIIVLKRLIPAFVSMKPLTALSIFLAGSALWLLRDRELQPWKMRLGLILAILVMAIGCITFLEYILKFDSGVDLWLFRDAVLHEGGLYSGRPAPATAFCIVLLGVALLTLRRNSLWLTNISALSILSIGLLAVIGYIFGVSSFYSVEPYSHMALHTALVLLVLAIGILSVLPGQTPIAIFTNDLAGGILARRLIPAALLIPLMLAWLRLQGELWGLYDARFGLALYATANVAVFVSLIFVNARLLNQVDLHREQTIDALRQSEQRFSTTFRASPAGMTITNLSDGKFIDVNESFLHMLEYRYEEVIGHTSIELNMLSTEDRAIPIAQIREHGHVSNFELKLRSKSGRWLDVLFSAEQIELDGQSYALATILDLTERRQAEEQLRYQAYLLENINDAVIASDENFVLRAWNHAAEKMYGWRADEVLGRRGVDILQSKFPGVDADEMRRQIAETGRYIGDATQLKKDGTRIHVEAASIALNDLTGKFTGYVSVNRDITERKQAEEQFFLAVESAPNAIVLTNEAGTIYLTNNQAVKIFGYDRHELIGLTVDQLVPERYRQPHPAYREGFFSDPQTRPMGIGRDLRALRKDGSEFPVEIGLTPLQTTNGLMVMATIVDITARQMSEENLRTMEARYRTLVEQLPIVVYINPASDITITTYINPQIESYLGYTQQEWLQDPKLWSKLLHSEDFERVLAEVDRTDKSGDPFDMEYRIMAKDGTLVWIHDQSTLVHDPAGRPLFWQGLMMNLTERKRAEKERETKLVLEAKNAELDRFAYTVSHDLKSPLVTIRGFLGFLKKDLETGNVERMRGDLNHVEHAVDRMNELLTGVLDVARAGLTIKQPQEIHFEELTAETLKLLQGSLTASDAQVVVQRGLPIIWGDQLRLRQVIQNLIENSIKYRDSQKPLRIEIGSRASNEDDHCILFVRDNGIGIPLEYHEQIFELFNQVDTHSEAGGVGLATVKRIIEVHGGHIWIESDVGKGSIFLFTLPTQPHTDSVI